MADTADFGLDKKTWDWTLAGQVNNFYAKIINREVDKSPYSSRSRNKHFFLKKRKWYKKVKFFSEQSEYVRYNSWNVTDMQEVNDSTCKDSKCVRYYS